MRGVILAGGQARRLRPLSLHQNKHLLHIHDEPLVCYPLRTLVRAGIRDIVLVTNAGHVAEFEQALGDGSRLGARLTYAVQDHRAGTGAALLAAEAALDDEPFVVILGDNIFTEDVGPELHRLPSGTARSAAKVFVRAVSDPTPFGVAVFEGDRIVDVVEKPIVPPSQIVATGLWILQREVFDRLRQLQASRRGESEMTDVLAAYARERVLAHAFVTSTWMDVGTFEALVEACALVERIGVSLVESSGANAQSDDLAQRPALTRPERNA